MSKDQNPQCLFRDSLRYFIVFDFVIVKITCGISLRRVSQHTGMDFRYCMPKLTVALE